MLRFGRSLEGLWVCFVLGFFSPCCFRLFTVTKFCFVFSFYLGRDKDLSWGRLGCPSR